MKNKSHISFLCPSSSGPGHSCGLPVSGCSGRSRGSDQGESGCYPGCCPVRQQRHHCFHRCAVFRSDKVTNCCRGKKVEHTVYVKSSSCVLSGLVMVAVIIGSRKVGINPDNVATPIAASLGDLITLSLLAGVSSLFFCYRGQRSHITSRKALSVDCLSALVTCMETSLLIKELKPNSNDTKEILKQIKSNSIAVIEEHFSQQRAA